MTNKNMNFFAKKLVAAFLNNKIIKPIPKIYTSKLIKANSFRKLCESKIKKPIIGFKAGGTAIPLIKKLKEKEPFYASVYKHNVLKNNSLVKKTKYTLGIELEVCYLIKKDFFNLQKIITEKNLNKVISHIGPCIEVVGYRQRKKGIKSFGDLCSDFGGNIKFVIGKLKKYTRNNVKNLKTNISNLNTIIQLMVTLIQLRESHEIFNICFKKTSKGQNKSQKRFLRFHRLNCRGRSYFEQRYL